MAGRVGLKVGVGGVVCVCGVSSFGGQNIHFWGCRCYRRYRRPRCYRRCSWPAWGVNGSSRLSGANSTPLAKVTTCFNCKETGHFAKDCPHPPRCRHCGAEGHFQRDCPKLQKSNRNESRQQRSVGSIDSAFFVGAIVHVEGEGKATVAMRSSAIWESEPMAIGYCQGLLEQRPSGA